MCLHYKSQNTRELAHKLNKHGKIIGYKLLRKVQDHHHYQDGLISIYFSKFWKPGWIKSNRISLKNNRLFHKDTSTFSIFNPVNKGIHIFTNNSKNNRSEIKTQILCSGLSAKECVIIPITCYKKDFVAAGSWDGMLIRSAVFMKVFLKKEDYDKALKGEYNV